MPTVNVIELLIAVMPYVTVVGMRVIVALLSGDTVKLAISEAFRSFAPTGRAPPAAPQGIAKFAAIFPIHAILFFLSFLINYYPTAAA
jgi:hypothetical protein